MDRPSSPEKRSRAVRNPLRRGPSSRQNMQQIDSPPQTSSSNFPPQAPQSDVPLTKSTTKQSTNRPTSPPQAVVENNETDAPVMPPPICDSSAPMTNGIQSNRDISPTQETQPAVPSPQVQRDQEGYSMPSSAVDDITRAQREAAASGDVDQNQFKLNIRDAPIREEDQAAQQTAFSTVASTLRAVSEHQLVISTCTDFRLASFTGWHTQKAWLE